MTASLLLENYGPSGIEVTIDHIHIYHWVLDPKKSIDFYVDALGMKKVGKMHFRYSSSPTITTGRNPTTPAQATRP